MPVEIPIANAAAAAAATTTSMSSSKELRVARKNHIIDDRIVTLRVGPDPNTREFSIHEAILRSTTSPFFRSALDKKWREGSSRQIDLPQESPEILSAFLTWSYFKTIASLPTSPPALPLDDGEFDFLAHLYCFAEKFQIPAFADDIISAMALKTDDVAHDGTRTFPSHTAISILYSGTPQNSPARRFVCDMYCEFGISGWIPQEAGLNHPEFLQDLVRASLGRSCSSKRSVHKHSNYPRRRKWHKCVGGVGGVGSPGEEFLQIPHADEHIGEAS